jgi:L-fucose mutarotase
VNGLLTGGLLAALDAMGHSDGVVISDAHFPAERLSPNVIELPGIAGPAVAEAVFSVLPLDSDRPVALMGGPGGELLPVHVELLRACGLESTKAIFLEREQFYAHVEHASLIVRCGEIRPFGNVCMHKGVIDE